MVLRQKTASDHELVPSTVRLPKGLLRQLKVYCAKNDTSQQQVLIDAVAAYLDKYDKDGK